MEISKAILKVIEGDFNQVALLNDQTERPISVVSVSRNHDLALILVTASAHPPIVYSRSRDPHTRRVPLRHSGFNRIRNGNFKFTF